MPSEENKTRDEERHWEQMERGSVSFDLQLHEAGDLGSGFHTKNDPESPYQRSNVVQRERRGTTSIKCTCVDIVHGKWGPDQPNARATLVVLLFRFDPLRKASRIISAHMEFKFFDSQGRHRKNPEVVDISLNKSCSLNPTRTVEQLTRGIKSGVVLGTEGGGMPGINLSTHVKYEKRFERETNDFTYVVGRTGRLDASFGPNNAASWTLEENTTKETGIPAAMRVGILLKRSTDDDFFCTVALNTKTDMKTRVKELLGGREADDPIIFNPAAPPTNRLIKYDVDNLGGFDVAQVEDLAFANAWASVV